MELSSKLELERNALRIRQGIIRAISSNHGGHIGGSLDLAELMSVLYTDFIKVDPTEPRWDGRDFFIMSKGHAGPALYATLAMKGFFPSEHLENLNNPNSLLPGHCDRTKVPGVDATSGSLGQGLSLACGIALAARCKGTDQRVYCVTGDGESAEGQIWEAAQFAAHYHLDHIIAFLDWNGQQIDGSNEEVLSLGNPVAKYHAFGWNAVSIDGHDVISIQSEVLKAVESKNGRPTMIILKTIKGKGSTCIENMKNNHCIGFPDNLREQVLADLKEKAVELGMED